MISLPSSRRYLPVALLIFTIVLVWRYNSRLQRSLPSFVFHQPPSPRAGIRVPIADLALPILWAANRSQEEFSPLIQHLYIPERTSIHAAGNASGRAHQPIHEPHLQVLWKCPRKANKHTNHMRLSSIVQNISQVSLSRPKSDGRTFWNPTVMALPYWSENQYLIVSRIVTDGTYQENVLCEANFCHVGSSESARTGEKSCTDSDLSYLGPAGGLRCVTPPMTLRVPPTPAKHCEGKYGPYVDVLGFHDPRVFYGGKGEPLMIVNTQ